MARTLHSGGYATLVFQAVACDAARQEFALFVDKLKQEVRVFVVNVLNAEFAEAAVFFTAQPKLGVAKELDIFS